MVDNLSFMIIGVGIVWVLADIRNELRKLVGIYRDRR
jgi:hypothetical protein